MAVSSSTSWCQVKDPGGFLQFWIISVSSQTVYASLWISLKELGGWRTALYICVHRSSISTSSWKEVTGRRQEECGSSSGRHWLNAWRVGYKMLLHDEELWKKSGWMEDDVGVEYCLGMKNVWKEWDCGGGKYLNVGRRVWHQWDLSDLTSLDLTSVTLDLPIADRLSSGSLLVPIDESGHQ